MKTVIIKYLFVVACVLVLVLSFTQSSSAHQANQPPFFKINDVYCGYYPVPLTSIPDKLVLAQDLPPQSYLVNEPIQFEIDTQPLGIADFIVKESTFTWDFGDGEKADGLKNKHAYKKMGSYILSIHVDYKDMPAPVVLETVLVNIVPDKNYELPKAVIKVNGRSVQDPLTDSLNLNYKNPLEFDAQSSSREDQIESYLWDFGDTTSSSEKVVQHQYGPENNDQVFPVLRIKTKDGFISDTFLQINRDESVKVAKDTGKKSTRNFLIPVLIVLMGVGGTMFFILKSKSSPSSSS